MVGAAGRVRRCGPRRHERLPACSPPCAVRRCCSTASSPARPPSSAARIAHRSREWWLAGHRSTEPAQAAALDRLRLTPVVDFGLRLGEGTGALVALPVLRAAQATLAEMATFDEADVTGPDDAEA